MEGRNDHCADDQRGSGCSVSAEDTARATVMNGERTRGRQRYAALLSAAAAAAGATVHSRCDPFASCLTPDALLLTLAD